MKKRLFIKEDEILIILCDDENGDIYVGPIESSEEILELVDNREAIQRLLRLDLITLHADDISEDIADIYISQSDMMVQHDMMDCVQPFILNSEVYRDYLEQNIANDYERSLYGSYEQQHRLRLHDVLSRYDTTEDERG
nr:hypothetical protein [Bartonella ancashensis]